ncbi:hypothetical protein [Flavivirga spongiicola]|uniref:Uncharacterized protein n=1 Tax=Flavivirga spongiicola TaxID=421621 RepID=A0ABU7XY14_9FLAO|nr:hypothetical protein [Flavivirga sp. MEBiC05379]MDO5980662.1 hypothetical protein [Flavivirga sp. MEBiC05379]
MSNLGNAQNSPDIIGLYNLGASSPEGGSHLFVLENNNYAITYFGGILSGKWKITKDNICEFMPIKRNEFELLGRHNIGLKGSTKICFNGFENSETFIQLRIGKEEEITMQRVFNPDANCFSYNPYVYTFKTIANSISFMAIKYDDSSRSIVTIENPDEYNDFVANFIEIDSFSARPFFATFKDEKLYFEEEDFSHRTPIDKNDEDVEYIKNMIDAEANRDTIYYNPSYNIFGRSHRDKGEQNIHEHHIFDEQKNAYINTQLYTEDIEYKNSDESFEDMSIIYAYTALKEHSQKSVKYKINEKPLFQVNCK